MKLSLSAINANDWINAIRSRLKIAEVAIFKFVADLVPIVDINAVESQPLENLYTFRAITNGETIIPAKPGYRFVILYMELLGISTALDASNLVGITGSINNSQDIFFMLPGTPSVVGSASISVGTKVVTDMNTAISFYRAGFTTLGQGIVSGYYLRA